MERKITASRISRLFERMTKIEKNLKKIVSERSKLLNGDRYITEAEMADNLKVHARTLRIYRSQGYLPYYKFVGKIYYKEKEIIEIIEKNRYEAFRL